MSRFGVDYGWGYRPGLERVLRQQGVTFAARYISHDPPKDEHLAEALALAAAGIDSVLVFETTATRAEAGMQAGIADAQAAKQRLTELKVPAGRPVFWAVDEDTAVGPHITGYAEGWQQILPGRHGPYGGFQVVNGVLNHGLARWAWQTYAWSGGRWDRRAQLRQYSNGHLIAGVSVDYDAAVAADFGQWRPQTVRPPVPPRRPPAPTHALPPWDPRWPIFRVALPLMHSHVVDEWQQRMVRRGWRIVPAHTPFSRNAGRPFVADGIYGDDTAAVAWAFQYDKRLRRDGELGRETWEAASLTTNVTR